jgi:hypothetical protein
LEVNLAEPLRALSRAIGRYGLVVAGTVDDDPASVVTARKALRPIDDHRAGKARRSGGGGATGDGGEEPPPATPTTPIPEVDG